MLVGEPPQTRRFGTKCPKALAAEPALSGLFLIFPSPGDVKQMVDIALDGNQFPHGLLRGPVLRGQGLFRSANSRRSCFNFSILGSFAPSRISFMVERAAR